MQLTSSISMLLALGLAGVLTIAIVKYWRNHSKSTRSELGARAGISFYGIMIGIPGCSFLVANISHPEDYGFVGFIAGPVLIAWGVYTICFAVVTPMLEIDDWLRRFFEYWG